MSLAAWFGSERIEKSTKAQPRKEERRAGVVRGAYLLSADYDGEKRAVVLKFYEPRTGRIIHWVDKTGHRPYCYTKLTPEELAAVDAISKNPGVLRLERKKLRDILTDSEIEVTKIVAADPLTIGGAPHSIRNEIPTWEADIKYYACYMFDNGLVAGLPYDVYEDKVVPVKAELGEDVLKLLAELKLPPEYMEQMKTWLETLSHELPKLKRVALDIEVYTTGDRVPDPSKADDPVIAAAIYSEDVKKVFLYDIRNEVQQKKFTVDGAEVEVFKSETEMISKILSVLKEAPIVVTFNGDQFDLPYLYERARKLGFDRRDIGITLGRNQAGLEYGIHLDLYKFFFNKSIQTYAFSQKYVRATLDELGETLLGVSKLKFDIPIARMGPVDLVRYVLRDAEITYKLTSIGDDLVMKLILSIARISNMVIDDVCRLSVSNWIRNRLIYEMRRRGCLVPNSSDIAAKGGERYLEPVTKGKKYVGAIVVEPKPGIHFDVTVLDFASLYPSIIKVYNISFETVNCPHEECKSNKVPGTGHWICTKRSGIASVVFGTLRDVRVKIFKRLAKDPSVPKSLREFYSVLERSQKVILNASYGVFGASTFQFYYLPAAESVTVLGRRTIRATIEQARKMGLNVLYGDTDSIFLTGVSEDDAEKLIEWSVKNLRLELEVDKHYRYAVFSRRKKNYIGVLDDGRVEVKGLLGKKRSTPPLIQKAFFDALAVLGEVESEKDFEVAREKIREIVSNTVRRLRARDFKLEELAISVMMSKSPDEYEKTTPQHVKAAKMLQKEGIKVSEGEIITFVKTTTKPGVKPVELCTVEEVDVKKYIELLRSTFEQVLDALDMDFDELCGESRLEFFM